MPSQRVHSSLPRGLRPFNLLQRIMIRLNVTPFGNAILEVPGRTSGKSRSTPLTIVRWNGDEWLQSPYGQTDWVRNVQSAGRCTLTAGFRKREMTADEVDIDTAAAMLQATVPSYPRTVRPHYKIEDTASIEDWKRIAHGHPVFRLRQP